jgi:NAD(P)-dependent dehydrogenase (short-subunit alcohol dehydrogenase family)
MDVGESFTLLIKIMFHLEKKIAIITGGGSGIGKAISILFAKQGATVCILDLDEKSNAVVDEIKNSDGKAVFYKCNVVDQTEVKNIIEEVAQQYLSIDILINNAGIAHIGTAENTSADDFDRLLNVNVKGVYNCLHSVIPFMKNKGGSILNLASVAALVGLPDRFAYTTTKGAVLAMTLSVAKDFLQYNIRCNSISPGRVHTPFVDGYLAKNYPGQETEMFEKLSKTQPIGRMGKPEEIAQLALYLCSEEASFITGCDYPIDGGFVKLNT